MSKFNFDEANIKNVFSGEDGILFVHQKENGENCIEINSDNLIDCVKSHLGPLFGDNFDAVKLWLRLITPKGKIIFNIDDVTFFLYKLFIPFFDESEKERYGKILDEWYEQIIAIQDGNYIWKLLEARGNEEIHDFNQYEGEKPFDKYGRYILERFDDLLGKKEGEAGSKNFYDRMLQVYADLFPNLTKEFEDLKNSKADWFMIFKPLIDIATLGIATELIDNTKIVEVITNFISTNMNVFLNLKNKWSNASSENNSFNMNDFFKSAGSRLDKEKKDVYRELDKCREIDKEFYEKLHETIKKATQMSEDQFKEELEEINKWANKSRNDIKQNSPVEEKKEAEKDWKEELKEKVSKQIDTILKRADAMSPEELTEAFTKCNNAVRDIINLKKLMKEFKKDVDDLKG